jgi:hypothetical protein
VAERLDPYGTWGEWDLEQFKVEIARWRDRTHPPNDVFARVDDWWRRLKQPAERFRAARVSRENDPQGNLWWMWVPGGEWLDEQNGHFRIQCFFRIHEHDRPPRLVCVEFRTVRSMSPAEADRADGLA